MEFDYYHEKDGEEFEDYFTFVRKVAMEDYELCETAQANLEKGVYSQGVLNPKKEGGVIREYTFRLSFYCIKVPSDSTRCIVGEGLTRLCADYQQQVKNLVMAAYKEELTCA